MKKFIKPEIEIIKIDPADVIATSGGGDTFTINPAGTATTTGNANDDTTFGGLGFNNGTQY